MPAISPDEFPTYCCSLCAYKSDNKEEFNTTYFIHEMCLRCFSDGMHYGWD
jgi:hypothetical protein